MTRSTKVLLGRFEGASEEGQTQWVWIYRRGVSYLMETSDGGTHPVHPSRRSIEDVGREVELVYGIVDPIWKPHL